MFSTSKFSTGISNILGAHWEVWCERAPVPPRQLQLVRDDGKFRFLSSELADFQLCWCCGLAYWWLWQVCFLSRKNSFQFQLFFNFQNVSSWGITKLDVTLNCQAVFIALFFFFLLLFFCQLWNSKTRRDFKLPDNFHCYEGLCHRLLQVTTEKFWNVIFIQLLISNKFFWISFGHEIGHNFGADHNRESGTVAPYEDAYGHWIQVGTWWKHD